MSALGSLVVKLALEHAEFTKGLDKSSQEALRFAKSSQDSFDKFERSAKTSFEGAVKNALALSGAYLGVTGALSALGSSINNLAVLDDLSQKTGASVSELSRLQKVAIAFGQDFGQVEAGLKRIAKGMGDTGEEGGKAQAALKALGVSSTDLSGKLRDPAAVMIDVAKQLQNYQDGAAKAALANDLMSKSGVDLLPFLNDAAENIDKFAGASGQAASQAALFQDQIGQLKVGFSDLVENLTIGLLPQLNKFIASLNEISKFKSIFSSVGGIDDKNISKEIASRKSLIASLSKSRKALSEPTFANKVNDYIFGDVKDLDTQITIAQDELKALEARLASQKTQASPYSNPTQKPVLVYNSADDKGDKKQAEKEAKDTKLKKLKAIEDAKEVALQESAFREKAANDYQMARKNAFDKRLKEETEKELEAKQRYLDLIQEQANKNFEEGQRAAREAEAEALRNQQQIGRELSQALTNGLFDSFRNGEKFGKAMVRNIVALGQTLFARLLEGLFTRGGSLISTLLSGGGSLFSGSVSAGEVLTGKGSSSIFGQLSSIKDLFSSGNNFFTSSIEKLGVLISNGNGGIADAIGGFVGENASAIADGFAYAGAAIQALKGNFAGAALTAIGTYFGGPIGGAIGGFIGGLFGGKKYKRFGTTVSGFQSAGGEYAQTGQGIIFDRPLAGTADPLNDLNRSFSQSISGFLKAFDISANIATSSGLYQRGKSKKSGGIFNATIDGLGLGQLDVVLRKASLDQVYSALVDKVLGEGLVKAIQVSRLSDGVKKFFDGLTKKEDVLETINVLGSLNQQLKDLPPVFNAVRDAINTTAYSSSVKELQAQMQATQTFVQLFYSSEEQFNIATKQLTSQLNSLNQALPTSREEYRKLVESINVIDEATRDQFNGLVSLAPAMQQYFSALEQQKEGIEQVNQALSESLDKNLFSTYADYITSQSLAANGLSYTGMVRDLSMGAGVGDMSLLSQIQSLKDEQANTRTVLEAIAKYTMETMKIQRLWNGDGLPSVRTV